MIIYWLIGLQKLYDVERLDFQRSKDPEEKDPEKTAAQGKNDPHSKQPARLAFENNIKAY